jgi:O-antigen/teichoic acid export membrane protein
MTALMGFDANLQYWNTRHKSFVYNSIALVVSSCVTVIIQLLWAFKISPSPYGLLLGSLGGLLTAITFQLSAIFLTKTIPALNLTIIKRIFVCLKQNRRFLQYSTPYTLFGVIRDRVNVLVMQMFLPMPTVGLYALAYRVMNFPVTLVSNALRPVFFQACSSQGVKAIESQLNRIMKWLVVLAMPCVVFYFYFADDLFMLFFGPQWRGAGHIGKFLIFPVVTFLLVNWMDRIMDVLGQQKLTLLLEVTFSTLSIFGLWFGFFLELGLSGALLIQCSVLVLYNIVYLIVAFGKAGYDRIKLFKLVPLAIAMSVITAFTLEILKMV